MFWDGRAPSLEGQAQGPIQNKIEMGDQSYKDIIERLRKISGYTEQFQKVFGTDVTLDGMAKAIATFERVAALSGNSKYDRYNKGDLKALSDSEKRGMVLFGLRLGQDEDGNPTFKTDVTLQKAEVHALPRRLQLHRRAVPQPRHRLGREGGQVRRPRPVRDRADRRQEPRRVRRVQDADGARRRADRPPTCTTAASRRSKRSMDHYNKGGNPNPALDKDIEKLNLTASEKADVVAFMKALTGEARKVDLPTLPAGPDGKTPDPRSALHAPAPKAAWNVVHPPRL